MPRSSYDAFRIAARLTVIVLSLAILSVFVLEAISIVVFEYEAQPHPNASLNQIVEIDQLNLSKAEAGSSFCVPTYTDNSIEIYSDHVPEGSAVEEVFCNMRFAGSDVRFDKISMIEATLSIKDSSGSVNQGIALNSGPFGIFCGLQSYHGDISMQLELIYNGFSTIGSIDDTVYRPVDAPKPEFGNEYRFRLEVQGKQIRCSVEGYEVGWTDMPLPLNTPITRFLQSLRVRSTGTTSIKDVAFSDQ